MGKDTGIAYRARMAGHSRQRQWQIEHRAQGLCTDCSLRALPGYVRCLKHTIAVRLKERKATGAKPWRPGMPGRIPVEAKGLG